jgi:hypothetical protein
MTEKKEYFLDRHRFLAIGIFLLIIWFGFIVFFYLKADEITKDPCRICSERMGEEVTCTVGTFIPVNRVYYPNGTIYEDRNDIQVKKEIPPSLNYSEILKNITIGE